MIYVWVLRTLGATLGWSSPVSTLGILPSGCLFVDLRVHMDGGTFYAQYGGHGDRRLGWMAEVE